MSEQPMKRGRPSGKRGTFTFRVSASLRERLQIAAAAAKCPVSEIIEARLEASFRDENVLKVVREAIREEMQAEFKERRPRPFDAAEYLRFHGLDSAQ